ncbi:S41 family peptidase [Maricaulis sp.]|uniref:S41 family peptidase n=1 Tax=Maricaulis sp. TaxID=1486257 RepID=UPI001AFDF7B7|nr:S41 family peptidase [Maricaulis sp.]MBO6798468.1 hypothetical protein [Maricaulis sp.]
MFKYFLFSACAVVFAGGALAQPLTSEALSEDISIARQALERVHPGYGRYTSIDEMDRYWDALEHAAEAGLDADQFYLQLSGVLVELRCDHTKAEFTEAMIAERTETATYLPFTFKLFEDDSGSVRMFVEASANARLARGDEILAIDGDPVSERIAAAARFVPVDGFTDHVRIHQMSRPGEILGTDFEVFDALLNPGSERVELEIAPISGGNVSIAVDRLTWPESQALRAEPQWRNFSDEGSVTVEYPADDVAVLSIETFVNYRSPVDPNEVYSRVFSEIATEGSETLIVDLRRNGGGSADAQLGLISWLIREPIAPVRDIRVRTIDLSGLESHLSTWIPEALNPQAEYFYRLDDGWYSLRPEYGGATGLLQPQEGAFDGELIVLTSASNSSGAAAFMGTMLESERAVLVGEPTGGSQEGPTAGIIFFLTLPNSGIVVRLPYQLTLQAVSNPVIGQGYTPDILVRQTIDDWLEGRDRVLRRAIEIAVSD